MPRSLTITANTKLTPRDHEALREKATACGLSVSSYLRLLVIEGLRSNTSNLLQTIEAEHIRLIISAAQRGELLTSQLLKSLRSEAIVNAPALLEQALHLVRQNHLKIVA